MRVAVVGCGPSGLVSAKYCVSSLDNLECLHIYERLACLGGIWCADPKQSILYDNLRTNLPKEVMQFQGLSYGNTSSDTSFITRSVVNRYLMDFAEKYQLVKYIKFETQVSKVTRTSAGHWTVTAFNLRSNDIFDADYDAVFICNGHYNVPEVPRFPSLEKFKQNKDAEVVVHSIDYRSPLKYKNLKVLVIGAGPSAQDISIDIASEAFEVYLSHHSKELLTIRFPDNIIHKPDVEYFSENGVNFTDGTCCQIDRVVLATGYRFQLDFLDDSCGIWVEQHSYVTPLYKQLINISQPTMALIGLPFRSFIFPLIETQVRCFIEVLNGKVRLPDPNEMHQDRRNKEESIKLKGLPTRKYHNIFSYVKEYMSELQQLGNLDPIDEVIFGVFEQTIALRRADLVGYRNYRFRIKDSTSFEATCYDKNC